MKLFLQNVLTYAFSTYVTSVMLEGLRIYGGLKTFIVLGIFLTLIMIIVKPIVSILTIPFNLLSFGLLSFLSVTVSLFITSFFFHDFKIVPFNFGPYSLFAFHLGKFYLTPLLSFFVISATIYILHKAVFWVWEN